MPANSGAEQCLPGECADVPDVSNAERSDDLSKVVFYAEHCGSASPGPARITCGRQ